MVYTITWRQCDKYHIKSESGDYAIAKAFFPNKSDGTPNNRYIPYFINGDEKRILSNGLVTVEAAKTVCEIHKKTRQNNER
jgi:hypothetical protein